MEFVTADALMERTKSATFVMTVTQQRLYVKLVMVNLPIVQAAKQGRF